MLGRIVEIAEDNRHLSLYRGFLKVNSTEGDREELGRVPLDDISAVIANAYGISYTNNILVALANMGAPFVLCAENHNAVGMLLPIEGNYEQSKRMDAQIAASVPLRKKLWASIVKSKLEQQACVLEVIGAPFIPIQALIKKIKSGDSTNIEAQAARRYWSLLFGKDFRRDRDETQINGLLNYGYTVLRATTARAIVAAGLHPSIGLYHSNAGNAMRLVDDLMEPFRPMVDLKVYQLVQAGNNEVNQETKRMLVRTMYEDMQTLAGITPLTVCTQKLATSLALVMLKERDRLELPLPSLPISLT
ncbi:MAG: type II CRISPR-associated endonuclease Cas1 [Alcaligenaceae bacterium]|jgi:CRISPR-associated protein Cas1|uniref:type II CRISPR-associated endonuclease Cas1 n=1 Tax=Advenella sp. EE-W14 TaxID=2722705 RepID=UPI00145C806F|nr:type II CRISPR-associated endonuclease Cas1 [Advenella sp. EE-W14]NLN68524.1 type II CRISPR-associated endonuclease Cas1 [Alcaligenaceae bacterium]